MDFISENLIIETYDQLMGVALGLALALAMVVAIFRLTRRKSSAQPDTVAGRRSSVREVVVAPMPPSAARDTPSQRLRAADQREFDRLAHMISTVSLRAEHVSETQSKVALKLDTVEMAMHRLLQDVDGLVDLPRLATPVVPMTVPAATAPRATLAA